MLILTDKISLSKLSAAATAGEANNGNAVSNSNSIVLVNSTSV